MSNIISESEWMNKLNKMSPGTVSNPLVMSSNDPFLSGTNIVVMMPPKLSTWIVTPFEFFIVYLDSGHGSTSNTLLQPT